MTYAPGRYLKRNDAKEAPNGQRLEVNAPMIVKVVSCHTKAGIAVIDVILDARGYPARDTRQTDLTMPKAFYKQVPLRTQEKVIAKATRGNRKVRIPPRLDRASAQGEIGGLDNAD